MLMKIDVNGLQWPLRNFELLLLMTSLNFNIVALRIILLQLFNTFLRLFVAFLNVLVDFILCGHFAIVRVFLGFQVGHLLV